jgi:uncharacterized membrane protein
MKLRWDTLGGRLGLLFCVAGFALIWAGWNGAASYNDIRKQFPFLISGGIAGLALVVVGVGLMVIQSQRADRVQLEANLTELRSILGRMTGVPALDGTDADAAGLVVAGPSTYHRPGCRLVAGRDLPPMTPGQASAAGLEPCRICGAAGADLANPDPASGTRAP